MHVFHAILRAATFYSKQTPILRNVGFMTRIAAAQLRMILILVTASYIRAYI